MALINCSRFDEDEDKLESLSHGVLWRSGVRRCWRKFRNRVMDACRKRGHAVDIQVVFKYNVTWRERGDAKRRKPTGEVSLTS